jgi:hypothetical protein
VPYPAKVRASASPAVSWEHHCATVWADPVCHCGMGHLTDHLTGREMGHLTGHLTDGAQADLASWASTRQAVCL